MPLTADYYLAQGASGRRFGNAIKEEVVSGRIYGLSDEGVTTKEEAMVAAWGKLVTDGKGQGSVHPVDASMTLREGLFSGFDGNSIDFRLRYSTFTGDTISSLVINIDSVLESVQQPFYPGTRKPILVGWTGRATAAGADKPISPKVTPDILKFNYLRPLIRLSGTKVFYGNILPEDVVAASAVLGCVNDDDFLGRPKGQWLMSSYATSQNKYGGTVAIRMEAISKGIGPTGTEDWRTMGVLFNDYIGRYVVPDPDLISETLTTPYRFDLINRRADNSVIYNQLEDGFVCFGPYPLIGFDDIWQNMGIDAPDEFPFPFVAPPPPAGP